MNGDYADLRRNNSKRKRERARCLVFFAGKMPANPTTEQSVHCAASELLRVAELLHSAATEVLHYELQLLPSFSLVCFQTPFLFPCPFLGLFLKSNHFPVSSK